MVTNFETIYVFLYDSNVIRHIRCANIEKALEYVFGTLLPCHPVNDTTWVEEKHGELWLRIGTKPIEYKDRDLLFKNSYVTIPKTIEELKQWLREHNRLDVLYYDPCGFSVRCQTRDEFIRNRYDTTEEDGITPGNEDDTDIKEYH